MTYEQLFLEEQITREQLTESVGDLSDNQHFLFDVFMRVGKSMLATTLINKWINEESKILILTGAETTNEQWLSNLEQYNPHLISQIEIYCYHSLHKLDREKYDIICLDEFDSSYTEKRWYQIIEFQPKHWIAMSGTLEEEHVDAFRDLTRNKFFHFQITLDQAVKWGILPQPKIFAVELEFDNTKPYLLYRASKNKSKPDEIVSYNDRWESLKNKKVNTLIKCTEFQYHDLICKEFERWKGYESEFDLNPEERSSQIKFMIDKGFNRTICKEKKLKIGNERKKFFADIKNRHFKTLFNQLPKESRVLVFCNDTAQADLLNERYSVHSKKPDSIELIKEFNDKKINYLFSCKKIDRGIDFVEVDYLIIVQSSMKQGSQSQRFGRALLSISPKTIVFYYPKTQDEKYVQEFLKQFRLEWIVQKKL